MLTRQIRLRDEQGDRRHRLPNELPIPQPPPPARVHGNMAGMPRDLRRHVLFRPHRYRALQRGIR